MEAHTPRPSPLAPMDPPETPTQPMPAPVELESPRLGILHLLVLTACVAVYMGVSRSYLLAFGSDAVKLPRNVFEVTTGTLYGIGGGAALAGLVLFLARRRRGLSFPTHPGEYLLVVMGFGVALGLAMIGLLLLVPCRPEADSGSTWLYTVSLWVVLGLNALVFLWALIRVKSPRWRIYFFAKPAHYLLSFLFPWGVGMLPWSVAYVGSRFVPTAVLIVVVLKDHMEGKRYSWTHWFGVGTRLWLDAATVGTSLWLVLVGRGPF